ncbi:MAG: cysteine-rich small domain-containing protein [Bacillota bacterium]|nr:cysteine-rich small domain-containing protein [Bacillota bacterium]
MNYKKTENFKFVQNKKCECFPCHKGIEKEKFNCLFCFCPLYMLGDKCGGNYIVNSGIKDCTNCTIPHDKGGYDYIMTKMEEVVKKASDF